MKNYYINKIESSNRKEGDSASKFEDYYKEKPKEESFYSSTKLNNSK